MAITDFLFILSYRLSFLFSCFVVFLNFRSIVTSFKYLILCLDICFIVAFVDIKTVESYLFRVVNLYSYHRVLGSSV